MPTRHRYLFVVGGVMSSVGKGVASSSIAVLLQARGYRVTAIKADPYVNVDAGTMNPTEHGEVFVTDDGDETDQDIGNYERFLDQPVGRANYMTTGRVYLSVIQRERNLEYGGRCVEVVPHIPEEIIGRIERAAHLAKADITVIEIGGTVGEYQNILFLEAARMMRLQHPGAVQVAMVSYLPIPGKVGEMKTKPTQYAVRTLNGVGIQPDFIICRSERPLDEPRRRKLSQFCNVLPDDVISAPDVQNIYQVPLNFERDGLSLKVLRKFGLRPRRTRLATWQRLQRRIRGADRPVRIAIVGKYFQTGEFTLVDSYLSVVESLKHAAWHHGRKPELSWLNSEEFERNPRSVRQLAAYDGVLVPGGFGGRGIEGKIAAIRYVREHGIPYFGLCYGMQLATVEFARHVAGLRQAHTTEIRASTPEPVIHILPDQEKKLLVKAYGNTMRLGAYPCALKAGSRAREAYKTATVSERHRHRYEFNNAYRPRLEAAGLLVSGTSPDGRLVEIVEIPKHPWFVGVQFHPEFLSRPFRPHPLFRDFIGAAVHRSRHR